MECDRTEGKAVVWFSLFDLKVEEDRHGYLESYGWLEDDKMLNQSSL